jgi:CMP-N-acetylneuraminic acid synthetase/spore coat polysaccharide biosynthesis predicted glycosyltransferase SpsG
MQDFSKKSIANTANEGSFEPPKILIIIPARGGSKGIPRKNVRLLNGKPLIYYAIQNSMNSRYNPDVFVTTEDEEIATISSKFGALIHKRPEELANDSNTLDPVIYNALNLIEKENAKRYDIVITMQPTSPLLRTTSLDSAIEKLIRQKETDTIISAQDDTHLTWRTRNGVFEPNYKKRVNRQYLDPIFKETGGFLITRRNCVNENSRIGKKVDLFLLSNGEEIDIDNYMDWNLCSYLLKKKRILIVVSGNNKIGMGHVYNTLILANDILDHDLEFLVTKDSEMAFQKIASRNYKVGIQDHSKTLIDEVINRAPDVVINDILDTDLSYIKQLKASNLTVINFEDLGEGAKYADLVVNAIYPEKELLPKHYFGQKYFILRDEFFLHAGKRKIGDVRNVLITFGGVDPNNLTEKTIRAIYTFCQNKGINIQVITGFGYERHDSLNQFRDISIINNVSNISDYMFAADLIFTSAGRTVYEIASLGTPAIVMAQNEREMTHFFAFEKYGFLNLGLGTKISHSQLLDAFYSYVEDFEKRTKNHKLMLSQNLKIGRKKVLNLISKAIESI